MQNTKLILYCKHKNQIRVNNNLRSSFCKYINKLVVINKDNKKEKYYTNHRLYYYIIILFKQILNAENID